MIRRRFNLACTTRDGVRLATDLYLPQGSGPHPTVMGRTPYNKNNPGYSRLIDAWNSRGYALVIQDVRGRGDSDGEFVPYRNESRDGADAVAWVAEQEWSDGNVVIQGASYGARSAWLAALAKPPALRALIVSVSPSDPFVEDPTGAHSPMYISWYRMVDGRVMQTTDGVDWSRVYEHLPLLTMDERAGFHSPLWRREMDGDAGGDHREEIRYQSRFAEIDLPVLHVSGWYDDEQIGTPLNYAGMVREAPSPRTRSMQRLLMGPWGHAVNAGQKLGEVDFGAAAVIDLDAVTGDFADAALGRNAHTLDSPPVRIFVMGANTWRDEQEWPLARTRFTEYFLHSGGNANSRFGDGSLDTAAPAGDEKPDTFMYDPARPVPFITDALSAQVGGPDDYAAVEQRGDVLCYTTPPLDADVELTGPVRLRLFASSSTVDTDFTAKLVDVHPNGFCQRLCDGVVRARYREGFDREVPMQPGTVYEFDVDMWNTCQVFRAGHRVRLEVSSSAFPKYARNLNTGEPVATATRMVVAENAVWHDAAHPSRLLLPVIPA